jgi:hypothetical protein
MGFGRILNVMSLRYSSCLGSARFMEQKLAPLLPDLLAAIFLARDGSDMVQAPIQAACPFSMETDGTVF